MNYFLQDCHAISAEIRRIAEEQVNQAISQIDDPALGGHETVYAVRKMCKRMRGLLRLGRSPLERSPGKNHFRTENSRFRDMARALSELRDADALGEAFGKLVDSFEDLEINDDLAGVRKNIEDRKVNLSSMTGDIHQLLETTRNHLVEAREQIPKWSKRIRSIESLLAGLSQSYGRAHKSMKKAYKLETDEGFHEWRKQVKYHRYHCFLMHQSWPSVVLVRRNELKKLTDYLGDEHDLAVLKQVVASEGLAKAGTLKRLDSLIERRKAELRTSAYALGERLFAENPGPFADRMAAYCRTWEETSGDEE